MQTHRNYQCKYTPAKMDSDRSAAYADLKQPPKKSKTFETSLRKCSSRTCKKASTRWPNVLQTPSEREAALEHHSSVEKYHFFFAGPSMGRPQRPQNLSQEGSRMKQKWSRVADAYQQQFLSDFDSRKHGFGTCSTSLLDQLSHVCEYLSSSSVFARCP